MPSVLEIMAINVAKMCRERITSKDDTCPVAGLQIICPLYHKARTCHDITPNDWIIACIRNNHCFTYETIWHKYKSEQPKLRSIKAILRNGNGKIICSAAITTDKDSHEKMEADCKKNLISTFRHKLAIHNSSMSEKTDQEIEAIMDALVALEGYTIEWESSGRD